MRANQMISLGSRRKLGLSACVAILMACSPSQLQAADVDLERPDSERVENGHRGIEDRLDDFLEKLSAQERAKIEAKYPGLENKSAAERNEILRNIIAGVDPICKDNPSYPGCL
jgi:hypothetical protein